MDHGRANLNTRRKAVEDESSDFRFQDIDQVGVFSEIFFCPMHRSGELSFERTRDLEQVFLRLRFDKQRRRAENLFVQVRSFEKRDRSGLENRWIHLEAG